MNVSQNRFTRLKPFTSVFFFALFILLFSAQTSFAQNFVNADQAAQILKQELLDLEDRGFTAYNSGNYTETYDLGYQYRYVQRMLQLLDTGSPVDAAVENGLPTIPFKLGNIETGQNINDPDLNARRESLRQYAGSILVL
jgi:hypothetical protein